MTVLPGRGEEITAVLAAAHDAARCRSSYLLLVGEAGIGKTTVVRRACREVADQADVVWASCLPMASLAVPLLPLRTALRHSAVDRMPAGEFDGADAVIGFDAWLDRAAARRPTVLVVDDVQWADQSTLDVLIYVLAGRPDRRLAVILTLRTGDGEDRLMRWLADVRRLPGFRELPVGRLDRAGTHEQIAAAFGRPPDEALVDEVHARAVGNPYLTSLLIRDLPPDAARLPPHLPTELRDALARAWRGMSGPARELTRIVAVGGRPQLSGQLATVARQVGFTAAVMPLLRESVDAGVLRADYGERFWFTHPLLAEVLVDGLLAEERRALHRLFAEAVDQGGELGADQAIDLADHYERAGLDEQAYRWALRGADAAEAAGGASETLRLLRRALGLWPRMTEPGVSRIDLLHRIRSAAEAAGREPEELEAVEELLDALDRPAASLLIRRSNLRFACGLEFAGVDDVREAVRLTESQPDSAEHALATAVLASNLLWHADPAGVEIAAEAIRLAGASGSIRSQGYALIARAQAKLHDGDLSGNSEAGRAWEIGAWLRDFDLLVSATYATVNTIEDTDERVSAGIFRQAIEELTALGAPHNHISEMCAQEASCLLVVGDWRACQASLRFALGARPGPMGDTRARLVAAELASLQGRPREARAHLARAEELFAEHSGFLVFDFDVVRVRVAIATGELEKAVATAVRGLGQTVKSLSAERLLPLAGRALADLADARRDAGEDPGPVVDRIDLLRRRHPVVVCEETGPYWDRLVQALQELADAETTRGRRGPGEPAAWLRAAAACQAAAQPWDEAYARWRLAQAELRDRSTRRGAVAALRRAHALATELNAAALLDEVTRLAEGTRISLAGSTEPASAPPAPGIPGLTARESEILGHIVAGRTYSEIAGTLVVSEKTISTHVSNMLRKTGATNRIELAQLANRLRDRKA